MALVFPMTKIFSDVIDFSIPIKTSGVSVVLRRPMSEVLHRDPEASAAAVDVDPQSNVGLLFVVRPLSVAAWLSLLAAFASVTGVVYLTDRLSTSTAAISSGPVAVASSGGSHQSLSAATTVGESVWTVLSTMLLVRSTSNEDRPRSVSSRLATGALAVFSLGIVVSYAVNMAAMRLNHRPSMLTTRSSPLQYHSASSIHPSSSSSSTLRDLVLRRDDLELVALSDDITAALQDLTTDSDAAFLRRRLLFSAPLTAAAEASVSATSQSPPPVDPLDRLRAAAADVDRAVVGHSSTIAFAASRDCELVQLDVLSDTTFHAFGLERRSTLRQQINAALLQLAEQGVVRKLQNK